MDNIWEFRDFENTSLKEKMSVGVFWCYRMDYFVDCF